MIQRAGAMVVCALLLAMAACSRSGSTIALPTTQPDIKGVITQLSGQPGDIQIMVEESPTDSTGSAKASVRVRSQAQLFARKGADVRSIKADELMDGLRVSVWYDGPVLLSYPARAGAKVVVVEE